MEDIEYKTEYIKTIYTLRTSFSIIGLTGRTGAGVSIVADILSKPFSHIKDIQPLKTESLNNKKRKYNILYRFAESNWQQYQVIKYRDVIFLHFIRNNDSNIEKFLNKEFKFYTKPILDFIKKNKKFINKIRNLREINKDLKSKKDLEKLYKIFYSERFLNLTTEFNSILKKKDVIKRVILFQKLANNLRKNGKCFDNINNNNNNIYFIAETINRLIKSYRINNDKTFIVIDSLRNSLEIIFFKERYNGFYMIAINSPHRRAFLNNIYKDTKIVKKLLEIDKKEYEGEYVKNGYFFYQDVQNCIQKSDIYFNHNPIINSTKNYNEEDFKVLKNDSLYYLVGQIIKYTSLMLHPGLVTPSAQERAMQIAYVAKENSGCISRKVGAVITDNDFSIKSVGWNDTPKGVTPCLLRNIKDLKLGSDPNAYSDYEKNSNKHFYKKFKKYYKEINTPDIKGLNLSYCFKNIQNYCVDSDFNQVHTRSLHAEENAMLQISKYGGQPLKNAILFTTASPCELCSKKARQLEITQIYYIDPYPGIANWHILRDGPNTRWPKYILYSGAVGSAYHKLYSPFMPYKDEIAIIINKRPHRKKKKKKNKC